LKRLFVTGASGFLGWNVCRAAAAGAGWNVHGAYLSHPLTIDAVVLIRLDLQDPLAIQGALEKIHPDAVVHCAAMPDPNICEQRPGDSYNVNVQASITLAAACGERGISLVYTSTDLVFDGEHAPYGETDPQGPLSVYGKHKAAAEKGMREAYPGVTVCRTPVMFGDPGPCSKSFIQPQIAALRQGNKVKYFSDEVRTPVSGATAAQGLLMGTGHPGETLHLGGPRRITRYEFGLLLCAAIGVPASLAVPVPLSQNTAPAPRPRDVSLVSEKAFVLGYAPRPLEEQLRELECIL
jgi:dTDP-4-dehydrorhamnose reductase